MISFRFHVVSITAVFLAIAIGVVVGSTYVDGAVGRRGCATGSTRWRRTSPTRKAENDRLEGELGLARAYIDASADFAVTDRLTDVPVLVVAARGRRRGRRSSARWRSPAGPAASCRASSGWSRRGRSRATRIAAALASIVDADRRRRPRGPLGRRPGRPSPTSCRVTPQGAEATRRRRPARRRCSAPLDSRRGFLTVDSLDDDHGRARPTSPGAGTAGAGRSPAPAPRTSSCRSCPRSRRRRPSAASSSPSSADVHVVRPGGAGPGRGAHRVARRGRRGRDRPSSTTPTSSEGQVASVLALDRRGRRAGRRTYGYGDGADGVLPAWTPP